MTEQGAQVVERIHAVQLRCVDQRHEQIPRSRTVESHAAGQIRVASRASIATPTCEAVAIEGDYRGNAHHKCLFLHAAGSRIHLEDAPLACLLDLIACG